MDPQKLESLIESRLRILGIICAALVGSVFIYGALAWFLLGQGPGEVGNQAPILPYVLTAFGCVALAVAPTVSGMVLRSGGTRQENPDPEQTLMRYHTSVIVGFAVRESAAVFGLVSTFLTGNIVWVTVLSIAAALSMIVAWPRKEAVLSALKIGPTPIG